MNSQERLETLSRTLDQAVEGLTAFDAEGLEWLQHQLGTLQAQYREQGLTGDRKMLAELLRKHSLLQAVLNATAANLKVMQKRSTNALDRREEKHGYPDLTAGSVPQRAHSRPGGAERDVE